MPRISSTEMPRMIFHASSSGSGVVVLSNGESSATFAGVGDESEFRARGDNTGDCGGRGPGADSEGR